jgi:UDP-N-acetylglucosamine--N-acetylmuramyl-(pentapeptide) pyrophosphoryl-undecaprenol N-acetylglucosamine transferase
MHEKTLRLLLTGGGTAGHVIPQVAIIEHMQVRNPHATLCYVGSRNGIENHLIQKFNIPYYAVITGKWRRYFSLHNLLVPFQVMLGTLQSFWICLRFKPTVIFSKGGFVALPVVLAGWVLRIPVIVHESDVIPGLANRLSFPLAYKICYAFDTFDQKPYYHKSILTGLPIRSDLFQGNRDAGLDFLKFDSKKPILFIWGGSLGAVAINNSIIYLLPQLTNKFQVVHLYGAHKKQSYCPSHVAYRAFEYLETVPLSHILACADLVISRAGATAIYELLVLHKPHILCPLSTKASRGEQIHNARYVENLGLSAVIYPSDFNAQTLLATTYCSYKQLPNWKAKLMRFNLPAGTERVYEQIIRAHSCAVA